MTLGANIANALPKNPLETHNHTVQNIGITNAGLPKSHH